MEPTALVSRAPFRRTNFIVPCPLASAFAYGMEVGASQSGPRPSGFARHRRLPDRGSWKRSSAAIVWALAAELASSSVARRFTTATRSFSRVW